MRRRKVIALAGVTASTWPLVARAQKAPIRIGLLAAGAATSAYGAAQIAGIKQGLRDNGLVEDRDYVLEARFAEGDYGRFPEMARDLARASARVILVSTIASARAAQNLMPPVPLVMLGLNTPVEVGLVASLARPGGHTTGVATLNEDLTPKLIEFQREVLPEARTLAVLFNPGNPSNPAFVDRLRLAAGHRGLTVLPIALNSSDELGSAFSTLSARRPDALQVVADSGILDVSDRIAALALELRLPSFATVSEFAQFGGLMSYGTAARRQWLRAALYVKKILDGATPADLPIERPTKIELSINLKTAIALGIAIPPTLASRADEIIE